MQNPFPGLDRRQHLRVPIDVNLFYRSARAPEFQMERERTGALDLSEGGVGFISAEEIAPFTEFDITFHLVFRPEHNPTISAVAMVRYCRPLSRPDGKPCYRVGASFTKIDEADRKLIAEYVRIFTSQKPTE